MTNSGDSPDQPPTGKSPKPRAAGEGPSGTNPPPSEPSIPVGGSPSRQSAQGSRPQTATVTPPGGGDGGSGVVIGESSAGAAGGGSAVVSAGMALLQIEGTSGGGVLVATAGVGGGGIVHRKRNRDNASPPQVGIPPFRCSVCGKEFPSQASVSGHMKTHPQRGWRGINPPPVFSREEFGDILALVGDPGGEPEAATAAQGDLAEREGEFELNLNEQPNVQAEEPSSSAPPRKLLDLNKSPSPEADDSQ